MPILGTFGYRYSHPYTQIFVVFCPLKIPFTIKKFWYQPIFSIIIYDTDNTSVRERLSPSPNQCIHWALILMTTCDILYPYTQNWWLYYLTDLGLLRKQLDALISLESRPTVTVRAVLMGEIWGSVVCLIQGHLNTG